MFNVKCELKKFPSKLHIPVLLFEWDTPTGSFAAAGLNVSMKTKVFSHITALKVKLYPKCYKKFHDREKKSIFNLVRKIHTKLHLVKLLLPGTLKLLFYYIFVSTYVLATLWFCKNLNNLKAFGKYTKWRKCWLAITFFFVFGDTLWSVMFVKNLWIRFLLISFLIRVVNLLQNS